MEKMQTINITMISNTLHNLTIKDNDHDDFEEVPLPGNSSYLPITQDKTIKKQPFAKANDKTLKKMPFQKEEEIAEEIVEEEELEEYYDDDFEEYVEESEGEKQKKQENILAYFENELGGSTLSPTKREKVNNAYRPLAASSVADKIKKLE
jgi:TATA-binding protein-associated factor Taf7